MSESVTLSEVRTISLATWYYVPYFYTSAIGWALGPIPCHAWGKKPYRQARSFGIPFVDLDPFTIAIIVPH